MASHHEEPALQLAAVRTQEIIANIATLSWQAPALRFRVYLEEHNINRRKQNIVPRRAQFRDTEGCNSLSL